LLPDAAMPSVSGSFSSARAAPRIVANVRRRRNPSTTTVSPRVTAPPDKNTQLPPGSSAGISAPIERWPARAIATAPGAARRRPPIVLVSEVGAEERREGAAQGQPLGDHDVAARHRAR